MGYIDTRVMLYTGLPFVWTQKYDETENITLEIIIAYNSIAQM